MSDEPIAEILRREGEEAERQHDFEEKGILSLSNATVYTTTKFQGQDVYYLPFIDLKDGRVGYAVRTNPDNSGRENDPIDVLETFIYFNVSDSDSENEPNVFVYIGGDNDPSHDEPQHWYAFDFNNEGGVGRDGEVEQSIERLARRQGIKPITDPSELAIGDLTDEEAEAFVNALKDGPPGDADLDGEQAP